MTALCGCPCRGLLGATVRQVVEMDGECVALVGSGWPAFRVGVQDCFIGWPVTGSGTVCVTW
jgi:hypothetical protein